MWHIGTILSIKNYPHGCQRGDTFVIYYICSDFWFPLLWEKGFFGICWFSSFPTATFLIFLHLPHFHGLITRANLPTIVTHNNTRQHTTTHDDAHPYNCSCWRWSQRRTPKFGLYHMLCRFCMFFFYAYDFYWLAIMAPLSTSVFVVDWWLFWGFDDDCNDVVAIAFFVVVIIHLASIVKPLLLCSLLYSQTSFILFSIMKLAFSSLLWNFLCYLFVNIQLIFVIFLYRMYDEISLILHHNSKFIQNANGTVEYADGKFCVWEEVETNLVNVCTPQELWKTCRNYVKLLTL